MDRHVAPAVAAEFEPARGREGEAHDVAARLRRWVEHGEIERVGPWCAALRAELGYGDDDVANGGSDRLVDAIVAWGDETVIARRFRDR
jgi:hypothetical protein